MQILNYHIKDKIYEGTNIVIYRAAKIDDQNNVILKVLKAEYPRPSDLKRMQHEFEIASKFDLDGIIKAYEILPFKNGQILVMEDFGGRSLRDIIHENKLTLEKFLIYSIQLAGIIDKIHHQQIIHKDVKPANILVNEQSNQIKITDFGISSYKSEQTTSDEDNLEAAKDMALEGTFAYISPEQTGRVNQAVDHRSDLYSLGITFYELLTGNLPFHSEDTMELVHCHIAKIPQSPLVLNPEIPEVLAAIVMKLLAKNVNDRYQSAFSLLADLQNCEKQYTTKNKVDIFELGQYDVVHTLQLSDKLFGREHEKTGLIAALNRICDGKAEVMIISGNEGMGKSCLVREVITEFANDKVFFISGKYSSFKKDVPYNAILQAFKGLLKQLLTESETKIQYWKNRLLNALGQNGQLIVNSIPELELIIGKQPELPELGPTEAQNRFNLVMQNFFNVFTDENHPLIMLLDDFHFTDMASYDLLKIILSQKNIKYFLLIIALQPHDGSSVQTTINTNLNADELNININYINLYPLTKNQVNDFISDALRTDPEQTLLLADLILQKTNGNPFFIREFLNRLYQEEVLVYVPEKGWQWESARINQLEVTKNVIDHMSKKVTRLPENTQSVLKWASVIGNRFDLGTLTRLIAKPLDTVLEWLNPAVEEGLIQLSYNIYRFSHDRIQEATYSLLSETEKTEFHYKIGNFLLKYTPKEEMSEKIFFIVNHLNIGAVLAQKPEEKIRLAKLNLSAATKAKMSTAYHSARSFLSIAMDALNENDWTANYELTFKIYKEFGEIEYLCNNYDVAEKVFDLVLRKTTTKIERAKIISTKVVLYTNISQYLKAIQLGVSGLAIFHISVPESPGKAQILAELLKAKFTLGNRPIRSLLDHPTMQDPERLVAIKLLMDLLTPAYYFNRDLMVLLALKLLNISLKEGNAPASSYSYLVYGMIIGSKLGDYKKGYEFGQLALELYERKPSHDLAAKLNVFYGAVVNHWTQPITSNLPYLEKGYKAGLELGDLMYIRYSIAGQIFTHTVRGETLDNLYDFVQSKKDIIIKAKNESSMHVLQITEQMVMCLKGLTENEKTFQDVKFNEAKFYDRLMEINFGVIIHWYYHAKMRVAFFFGHYEEAMDFALKGIKFLDASLGQPIQHEHYCIYSLIMLALYADANYVTKKKYWKTADKYRKLFAKYMVYCPENFEHYYYLISAEMARIQNNDKEALIYYDKAIHAARSRGFLHFEAKANELAMKFYITRGRIQIAKVYFGEAKHRYLTWGANKIYELLDKNYPDLITKTEKIATKEVHRTKTRTSAYSGEKFDLSRIMKITQEISGEINLGNVLQKLIQTTIDNSGGSKCYIMLRKDDSFVVIARKLTTTHEIEIVDETPIMQDNEICHSIINYVLRTKDHLLINDPLTDDVYGNDPYVLSNRPKSILCSVMVHHAELMGLIYLEKAGKFGAIKPDSYEIIKLLSTQAAISIENAKLHKSSLEQERLTRELAVATQIQNAMLPRKIHHIEHLDIYGQMQPAKEVGGDYFDIIPSKDNDNFYITIGDVSGKGVPASLLMIGLRTIFHSFALENLSTRDILINANQQLYPDISAMKNPMFITLMLMCWNQKKKKLYYTGAGHEQILVYRIAEHKCENLKSGGVCLGIVDNLELLLQEKTLALKSGDVVMIYTDGITEYKNQKDELFGLENLKIFLAGSYQKSPREIVTDLFAYLENYGNGVPQYDDITCVVFKYIG